LIKNWGVSFLINDDVLFDTFGKPRIFFKGISKLKINILKLRHIIISHDHWDHTSGLWDILDINNNVTVYVCSHADTTLKAKIKSLGARLQEIDSGRNITENVYTTGELSKDGTLYEQSVCIKSEKGLVVVTGCAHPGIVEIIQKAQQQCGDDIYAVIGGFHLKDSSVQEIEHVITELKKMNITYCVPLHCTGKEAVHLFQTHLQCVSLEKI